MPRDASLIALGIMCLLLGSVAWLRPAPGARIPQRMPSEHAQTWMTDALPGIGTKTRERTAQAIRSGQWNNLPDRARPLAEQVFIRAGGDK
jgi:hypothetical protein